jgi:hypothetical protein
VSEGCDHPPHLGPCAFEHLKEENARLQLAVEEHHAIGAAEMRTADALRRENGTLIEALSCKAYPLQSKIDIALMELRDIARAAEEQQPASRLAMRGLASLVRDVIAGLEEE